MVIRVLGIVISVHTQNNGNITISIPDVLVLAISCVFLKEGT